MTLPKIITITADNIDREHICCAIGDKKHEKGLSAKKDKKETKRGVCIQKSRC
ncbi:MAG: hypothetical protein AB1630_06030 [bacterium]